MKTCVGVTAAMLVSAAASGQIGMPDQVSPIFVNGTPSHATYFNVGPETLTWDAQVRAGMSGRLEGIRVGLSHLDQPGHNQHGPTEVRLRGGTAAAPGPVLATRTLQHRRDGHIGTCSPTPYIYFLNFASARLDLNAGDTFVLEFQGQESDIWVFGTTMPTPAYPEPLFLNGEPYSQPTGRIGFETFMLTGTWCEADLTSNAAPGAVGYAVPNGVLNNDDFFFFLTEYAAGNLASADMTSAAFAGQPGYGVPNGVINNDDFFYYLAIFAAGC